MSGYLCYNLVVCFCLQRLGFCTSQVIGCEDCLRSDLCVSSGMLNPTLSVCFYLSIVVNNFSTQKLIVFKYLIVLYARNADISCCFLYVQFTSLQLIDEMECEFFNIN